MANDPLTMSAGCRDGESLCRVMLPERGDLALMLDGVSCSAGEGGYQCGDRFLPEVAPRTLTWLPGRGQGTLAGSQHTGFFGFRTIVVRTMTIPERRLFLPDQGGAMPVGWRDRLLRYAEETVAALPNPADQVKGFLAIAAEGGALRLVERALVIAETIGGKVFGDVAVALAHAGQYTRALAIAGRVAERDRPSLLNQIAAEIAHGGRHAWALRVADGIKDDNGLEKTNARLKVALHMAEAGRFREALRVARRTKRHFLTAHFFAAIAAELAKRGYVEKAIAVASEADGLSLSEVSYSADYVIEALAEHGLLDRAMWLAGFTDRRRPVDDDLPELPHGVGVVGEHAVITALAKRGDFARARALATHGSMEPQYRAGCLGTIARYLAERGVRDEALTLFAEAVRVANTIGNDVGYPIDPWHKASALSGIVREMAAARLFPEAVRLAAVIVHAEEKAHALASVAKEFARAGRYDRAIAVAEGIAQPVDRV